MQHLSEERNEHRRIQIIKTGFHMTVAISWGRWMTQEAMRKEVRSHCRG